MGWFWHSPPATVGLPADATHLWRASLDLPQETTDALCNLLPADEQARAERFLLDKHRRRFIVARSVLRNILAHYLGADAAKVAFDFGPQGKPCLARDSERPPLHFNVSHSSELAVFAFSRDQELGIDVECIRPLAHAEQLAERFFSPRESALLKSLAPDERTLAFLNGWTRKEAFLKATGKGIAFGLERVEVTVHPEAPARIVSLDGDEAAAAAWSLSSLTPSPGYIAALAMARHGSELTCWNWEA